MRGGATKKFYDCDIRYKLLFYKNNYHGIILLYSMIRCEISIILLSSNPARPICVRPSTCLFWIMQFSQTCTASTNNIIITIWRPRRNNNIDSIDGHDYPTVSIRSTGQCRRNGDFAIRHTTRIQCYNVSRQTRGKPREFKKTYESYDDGTATTKFNQINFFK